MRKICRRIRHYLEEMTGTGDATDHAALSLSFCRWLHDHRVNLDDYRIEISATRVTVEKKSVHEQCFTTQGDM